MSTRRHLVLLVVLKVWVLVVSESRKATSDSKVETLVRELGDAEEGNSDEYWDRFIELFCRI